MDMIDTKECTKQDLEHIVEHFGNLKDESQLKTFVKDTFEKFDVDKNDYLDKSELKNFLTMISHELKLTMNIDDTVVDTVFGKIDLDQNHKIEISELEEFMKNFVTKMAPLYVKALEDHA